MTSVELFKAEAIVNLDQWREAWGAVGIFEKNRQWIYGDLILKGKEFIQLDNDRFYTWDEIMARILKNIPHVEIEPKSLINWALIADKFPIKKRFASLTWSHHRELFDFPNDAAAAWLRRAEENNWSVSDLREAIAKKSGNRCEGPPIARFVPRRAVWEQVRWFRQQFDDIPLEDWPQERRIALKREYQPLLEILSKL